MHQAPSVLRGRGGMSSLWGVWHWDEALWHGPMPYKGGDGQRPLQRRCLQSLCSTLEWRSRADGVGGIMVLCVSRQYTPVFAPTTSQSLPPRNPPTLILFSSHLP